MSNGLAADACAPCRSRLQPRVRAHFMSYPSSYSSHVSNPFQSDAAVECVEPLQRTSNVHGMAHFIKELISA